MYFSVLYIFVLTQIISLINQSHCLGTKQSAAARGNLICNGKPSVNTKVKLYDQDTFDPDDLMDEGVTDEEGHFELSGSETEVTDIEPKVNIYHNCNDELTPCLLKISIEIPDDYITQGSKPKKTFNVGTLNLEGKFSGQTRDCFNK
uniref:Uncharacterized protein n=2 Tax=Meloidogyne TaxID=189290 RepID=A0A6V7XLY1_MELEN|nr:unnamed protein product [Meloidogyne enterolobii]CAD2200273.1 unnamed protein product [Meloidogyne enterolobii]